MKPFIPINRPFIGEEERKAMFSVLEGGELADSSHEGGKMARLFEEKVEKAIGVRHAVSLSSGTAALHASLLACGIRRGDEVVLPSFTFVATANAVLACGAKPVFADIGRDYNLDPLVAERAITKRTKAILPVHLYGYPAEMDEINEIASKHSLLVVEDAAQAMGSKYKNRHAGSLSDIGCFSTYANKVVTSGEGGIVTTDDSALAERVRRIRNHGESVEFGLNYRLPEISAAIASAQMDRLNWLLERRRENATRLLEMLKVFEFRQSSPERSHNFYLFTLEAKRRDLVLERLNANEIGAKAYYSQPIHKIPLYRSLAKLPVTERASRRVISLPVHPMLAEGDLERIAREFKTAIGS